MQTEQTKKRNRPRVPGSLRSNGKSSIAIDARTKKRLKVIAGSLHLSLWLRRDVDKHYSRYVMQLANDFEIEGFDENEEPILGKPLTEAGKRLLEDDAEPDDDNAPLDLTDINNWKKDYNGD